VLTAGELITVLEDMMGGPGTREVFEEFKQFLGFRQDPPFKYRCAREGWWWWGGDRERERKEREETWAGPSIQVRVGRKEREKDKRRDTGIKKRDGRERGIKRRDKTKQTEAWAGPSVQVPVRCLAEEGMGGEGRRTA
jgi:hypothetical protein